jgi:hypothetical protein
MASGVIIRLGSHSEKEYLLRTMQFLDGLILGANLVEATPGATSSFIVKACGNKLATPYFIDPMTYAFGTYVDRETGQARADLDWIKSDQKIARTKRIERALKRSYSRLGLALGGAFEVSVKTGTALNAATFNSAEIVRETSEAVVSYQLSRISQEFANDPEFESYAEDLPSPAAVFAPYFYAEPSDFGAWINANLRLATATARIATVPAHAVICVDQSYLTDETFLNLLKRELPQTGVAGVWLWFSRLREDDASLEHLLALRELVASLSRHMQVFNMHGGFFSLALTKVGLAGISHGIGYGEQKDVIPVIGQSTPMVRYYLPDIYKRVGVPEIERCFSSLGIKAPADFHSQVCRCVVCKGVVVEDIADFAAFGEMQRSTPLAKRFAQTPAAAKRCRFHFLLNRIRERDELNAMTIDALARRLEDASSKWGLQPTLRDQTQHLGRWISALRQD